MFLAILHLSTSMKNSTRNILYYYHFWLRRNLASDCVDITSCYIGLGFLFASPVISCLVTSVPGFSLVMIALVRSYHLETSENFGGFLGFDLLSTIHLTRLTEIFKPFWSLFKKPFLCHNYVILQIPDFFAV